jgi:hypothetical protein
VSDFLSRLAARAVRDVPRVTPAVPEAAHGDSRAAQPEVPVARALPTAPEVRAEAPEVRVEPEPGRERPPRPQTERVAAHASTAATTNPLRSAATHLPPPPDREPGETSPEPVVPREPVAVVTAVPIPAAPTIERRVESRIQRMHTVETVAADEPPVRVHIGRLEVRANLEQPPRSQPRREPARPPGQTLSDYLRGRRTA